MADEKEIYEVIQSGSVSFFDSSKPLAITIENPEVDFRLGLIFRIEKTSLKFPEPPSSERLEDGQIQITIKLDKNRPTGGATKLPSLLGVVQGKKIYIHFKIDVLQEEHILLEYTLFSGEHSSEDGKISPKKGVQNGK